jgi:hypothetical protein
MPEPRRFRPPWKVDKTRARRVPKEMRERVLMEKEIGKLLDLLSG